MRIFFIAAAILIGGFVAPAGAAEHLVDQRDLAFVPGEITIAAGDTIKFTNNDRTTHHVWTKDNGVNISSPALKPGESYTVTLAKAGTYVFKCHIHPKMKLVVTVE
jgi:plastocyanin